MLRRALHLLPFLLLLAAVLYGGASALASETPEASDTRAVPAPAAPHVALILPAESGPFGSAAEAVRAGFFQAWERQSGEKLPVRIYRVADAPQHVVSTYRSALAAGAQLVVGPLTRDGVTALARADDLIRVPTLALNVPESGASPPADFYMLSLHIESEARQVAQLALSEGRRKAFTVSAPGALGKRMRDAFIEDFERGGGHHIAEYSYTTDSAALERVRQAAALKVADMVFFALDAARLRAMRPYLAPMSGYGTSQVNPGLSITEAAGDLADVRFVDMPWMVQPDHPAVMIYARPSPRASDDLERLYALGIDAYRLGKDLLARKHEIVLDGVTGRLTLGSDRQFRRGLLVTLIDAGHLVVLGESRP